MMGRACGQRFFRFLGVGFDSWNPEPRALIIKIFILIGGYSGVCKTERYFLSTVAVSSRAKIVDLKEKDQH